MKIKRADDKPMVIHTKEKPRLRRRAPAVVSIKGRNIRTVTKGVNPLARADAAKKYWVSKNQHHLKGATVKGKPVSNGMERKLKSKTSDTKRYGSSTKEKQKSPQNSEVEKNGTSRPYQKSREKREALIKKKTEVMRLVGGIGAKEALQQMEGGEEISDAALLAYQMERPVARTYAAGKRLYQNQVQRTKEERIKKKRTTGNSDNKAEEKSYSKQPKEAQLYQKKESSVKAKEKEYRKKKYALEKVDKAAKNKVKQAGRKRTGAAITAAGGGVLGAAVAQEANRMHQDRWEVKGAIKNRMIQLFFSKLSQEESQDTMGKTLKDIVRLRGILVTKYLIRYVGIFLLAILALIALIALPLLIVIAILYHSPFAIFFPSVSSGETTQQVLSAYMQEFQSRVEEEVADDTGYDSSEKRYLNYEGAGVPDNTYDILAVYMVKYGDGELATDMTKTAKKNLKKVFEDMCSYEVTKEEETEEDEDGDTITHTRKYVDVTLKTYRDMISLYDFNQDEQKVLNELMKPEYLALLGYTGSEGNSGKTIDASQYQAIVDAVSDANGKAVVEFVLSKVGYPYSQTYRDTGAYYDCSSLAYYAWKKAGVDISYGGATTAAAEGQYCYDNHLLVEYSDMQPGDLIFYSYGNNGRFENITHVAVYVGDGKVVEAANERIGVVYRPVQGRGSIVFIGRPR